MTLQAQQNPPSGGGFKVPPAQQQAPRPADATTTLPPPQPVEVGPTVTSTDLAIIGVGLLVMAVLFLILKNSVARHLIGRRASPDSAHRAGWALWFLLFLSGAATLVGLMVHWIALPLFYGPLIGLVLLLLIIFIVTYRGALSTRP